MNLIPAKHKRGPVEIGKHRSDSFDMPEYKIPELGNTVEVTR